MPIKVLDPKVVSRIAAGEVVERPASVVKELVENSLDAGSSQISVEVRGSGVGLIRVTDNGSGIPAEEVELAFSRHATSKITGLDDLAAIATLGFRGEALPSIAAVAQIEIVTCNRDGSAGTYLSLKEGAVVERSRLGRAPGTTVTVRNLFRDFPARLKFLKSTATENGHVANVLSQYALAYPEVKFVLLVEGRTALATPGSGRLFDSVVQVYGLEVARNMVEVGPREEGWQGSAAETTPRVSGMVGLPAVSRANRSYLSFFVNRRWVNSRLLAWAVEEAYHGLLMSGKHPVAIVNISLPAGEVDVNIHPAKAEVKFQNEHLAFAAVQRAVRRALMEPAPTAKIEERQVVYTSLSVPHLTSPLASPGQVRPLPGMPPTPLVVLPVLRVLGQLLQSYIVAEGPEGLYLIDQHAAHERILFEQFLDQRSRQEIKVQGLLQPIAFEVSPRQEETLRSHNQNLVEFGFTIEPFGSRTYLVRTVPALLHDKNWPGLVMELLDMLGGESGSSWAESIASSLACHGAVRAGQVLGADEMRELIRKLEQAAIPQSCPHGRPTMISFSSGQLRKEFGRT